MVAFGNLSSCSFAINSRMRRVVISVTREPAKNSSNAETPQIYSVPSAMLEKRFAGIRPVIGKQSDSQILVKQLLSRRGDKHTGVNFCSRRPVVEIARTPRIRCPFPSCVARLHGVSFGPDEILC